MTTRKNTKAEASAGGRGAEIMAALPRMAAAAGVDLPAESGGVVPVVHVRRPLAAQCRAVGQILHSAPIFRRGREFVTVAASTGEIEPMDVQRFRSWHQGIFHFEDGSDDARRLVTCPKDWAAAILASDEMAANVRPLVAVHPVRLPVWRGDGPERTIGLLPAGYDAATGILTLEDVPYPEDVPLADAVAWLCDVCGEFPWHEGGPLMARRSFAAHVAAMAGTFCRAFFAPSTVRPLVIYNGNQPGTGKSKLCRMALAPVFGAPEEDSKPKSDEELRNVLDAVALAGKPYLVLDDCPSLHSHDLNRFVTSPYHSPRVKGKSLVVRCAAVTQVFASGNGLRLSEDLEQRSLVADLFEPGKAAARKFRRVIEDDWIFSPDFRRAALAALWAMVRHWRDSGLPIPEEARHGRAPSYGRWIGGIVMAAGWANPFAERAAGVSGGDEAARALESALAALAAEIPHREAAEWTVAQVLEALRERGTLDVVLPFDVRDEKKALGHKLKRLRGREFVDDRGRRFSFGRREVAAGAAYPVRILDCGPAVAPAPPAGEDGNPF